MADPSSDSQAPGDESMTAPRHASLAAGRWQSMRLVEQLANVGSEVERAIRADEQGQTRRRDSALARALELFDLTATDDRWRGPRRREVLRAREAVCRLFFDDAATTADRESVQRYFLQFAVAARR
jgi:hypothetical protein